MGFTETGWLYRLLVDPVLRDIRTGVAQFTGIKNGGTVLDVCCGTGDHAVYFARQESIVTGVELSESMVHTANKKKRKFNNLNFKVADASKLPFDDNSYQANPGGSVRIEDKIICGWS